MTGPVAPTSPPPGETKRRGHRWWWLAVLLVAIAGAVVAAGVLEQRWWEERTAQYDADVARETAAADTARDQAEDAYAQSIVPLEDAIDDGRPVLTASKGQVADPEVRTDLKTALDEAEPLAATKVTYPTQTRTVDGVTRVNPFRPGSLPQVDVDVVTGSVPDPADLDAATGTLTDATAVVVQARDQWAFDALQDATTEGQAVWAESTGLVSDPGTRTALRSALEEAVAELDGGVDGIDPDAAVADTAIVHDATEAVWEDRLALILEQRRDDAKEKGIDCTVDRCVALTFDDGPVPDTERLLTILAKKHTLATFFMVGTNVAAHPQVARDVVEAGHLVANHSWDHPQLTTLDDDAVKSQLTRTQDAISGAAGFEPFLLRPPYGDVDDRIRSLATRTGLDVVLWTLDSQDWRSKSARATRQEVADDVEPGSIVLLHDIHSWSIDAVPGIIKDLREKDYTLVTVDQLAPPSE